VYLLDTNVLSALHRAIRGKADARVTAWLSTMDLGQCAISVINVMELEMGILRIGHRGDDRQANALRQWLEGRILPEFNTRILDVTQAVAVRCAHLHVPDPQPERDAMIAATALVHGMTLVTRNVADFARTGVDLLNPWQVTQVQESRRRYRAR
jgi:predicted nucleic acid-binding protein